LLQSHELKSASSERRFISLSNNCKQVWSGFCVGAYVTGYLVETSLMSERPLHRGNGNI